MLTAKVERVASHRAPGGDIEFHVELQFVGGGPLSLGPLPESHPLVKAAKASTELTFQLAEPAEAPAEGTPEPAEPKKARGRKPAEPKE